MGNPPGMSLDGARWITGQGIILIGADQECSEVAPSEQEDNWLPGHCHFLAEAGVPMMELLNLEQLAHDGVYEFCFIGAPIRLRGATGSPLRGMVPASGCDRTAAPNRDTSSSGLAPTNPSAEKAMHDG